MLKWSSSESPTFKSKLESGSSLDQFDSLSMNMFNNENLNSQFSFKFTSKPKLKMVTAQPDDPVSQEDIVSNDQNNQTQSESQNISVNKQIELAKLRVQQLQLELQAQRLAASLNSISDSFQSSTLLVQFIQFDNRINNYRKEVTFKNSRLTFKLEETQNYDVWQEEVFVKTLTIHTKHILKNKKLICPADLIEDDDKRIWQVKSKAVFDILFTMINISIHHTIKRWIDVDQKNSAELWIALKAEYQIHAVNIQFNLLRKFITISIDAHNNDIQIYIFKFHNICNKLKNMNYEISNWAINNWFIDDLKTYYTAFIWMKWDEVQNSQEKKRIIKINLKQLMNQLIVRIMNHKKNRLKSNLKTFKNESNSDLKSDTKNNSNSNSNFKKLIFSKEKRKTWVSFNNIKICSYCHKKNHKELHCRMKNWKI